MATKDVFAEAGKSDPYLDAGLRGWIVTTAKKEAWKVAEWYSFEDLVGDGYLCYYKCRVAYLEKIKKKEPSFNGQKRWLMALVKRAYFNHISTLASKRMAVHERAVSQYVKVEGGSTDAVWDAVSPSQPEEASFMSLLASAPAEIKQLIQLLAQDGADFFKFERRRAGRFKVRETNNEFFCRIIGADPKTTDIVGRLKAHFG